MNITNNDLIKTHDQSSLRFVNKYLTNDSNNFNNKDIILCNYNSQLDLINNTNFNNAILIIISSDNDFSSFSDITSASKIYLNHINFIQDKFNIMPIGIFNLPERLIEISNSDLNKNNLCYANFSRHTHNSRIYAYDGIRMKKFVQLDDYGDGIDNQEKYFNKIRHSYFNCCPRGNGIDTYRLWESIYLRSIPILQESNFANNVSKFFHIKQVKVWTELNKKDLEDFYSEEKTEENLNTLLNFNNREFYIGKN